MSKYYVYNNFMTNNYCLSQPLDTRKTLVDPICSTHNYPRSPSVLTSIDMLAFQSECVSSSGTTIDSISDSVSILNGQAGVTSTTAHADYVQVVEQRSTMMTDTEQERAAVPTSMMSAPAQATPSTGLGLGYLSETLMPSKADGSAVEMSLLHLSSVDAVSDLPADSPRANQEGQYIANENIDAFNKANVSTSGYVRIAVEDTQPQIGDQFLPDVNSFMDIALPEDSQACLSY